ncbi:hypothetical protein KAR91_12745 [Candidatus Pacearchaeota archaeon]|nr:hypothetical protein [Candidatus Pacearchaeota archaeon]
MKVTMGRRNKSPFQPVSITITLDTQAELDALGSCFNASNVIFGLRTISGVDREKWLRLYRSLMDAGADINRTTPFRINTKEQHGA